MARAFSPMRSQSVRVRHLKHLLQIAVRCYNLGGPAPDERVRKVGEVFHMRSEKDGLSIVGRLEKILPSPGDQTAADKRHIRERIKPGELAECIQNEHVPGLSGLEPGFSADDERIGAEDSFDIVEFIRMAWSQDKNKVGSSRPGFAESATKPLLLARVNATRDENFMILRGSIIPL